MSFLPTVPLYGVTICLPHHLPLIQSFMLEPNILKVDYYIVRKNVLHKDLVVNYVASEDQPADIFTKGLHPRRFQFLRSKLFVTECPNSLKGGH